MCTTVSPKYFASCWFPLPRFASCPFSQTFFGSSGFPAVLFISIPAAAWVTHGPQSFKAVPAQHGTSFQECVSRWVLPPPQLPLSFLNMFFSSGASTTNNIVVTFVPQGNLTQNKLIELIFRRKVFLYFMVPKIAIVVCICTSAMFTYSCRRNPVCCFLSDALLLP